MPTIVSHCIDGLMEILQHWLQSSEKALPRLGRSDASSGAIQEARTQPPFERRDGMAERGARDAQCVGSLAEAAVFRHGQECGQVSERRPCAIVHVLSPRHADWR